MAAAAAAPPPLPAPAGRTVLLSLAALAGGFALCAWLASAGREAHTGYLQAHRVGMTADRDVRLKEILAAEGAPIAPDTPLALLIDETLDARLADCRRERDALAAELAQARARAEVELAWRVKELDADLHQARVDAARFLQTQHDRQVEGHAWHDVLEGRLTAAPSAGGRLVQPLVHERSLPGEAMLRAMLEVEAAANAAEVSAAQVRMCEDRIQAIQALKRELPAKVRRASGIEPLEARVRGQEAELARLEALPREITLTAGAYGTVGVYRFRAGDRIPAGSTVVELLDVARRFVTVAVPSRRLARFQPDGPVALRFPGGERRTGTLRSIPPEALQRTASHGPGPDAVVMLGIEPSGRRWPEAPIGAAVEVSPLKEP